MTAKDLVNYWKTTAEEDLAVAQDLFKAKRYSYCLFFSHLAVEKMIKGLVFKNTGNHAFPIHNLIGLCKQAQISLNQKQIDDLKEITSWNIEARYDKIKLQFHKKATREFTSGWFKIAKEYYIWFKNQF